MALIVGAFWFQTPQNATNFADRAGALTFIISYISFFTPAFKALFDCTATIKLLKPGKLHVKFVQLVLSVDALMSFP